MNHALRLAIASAFACTLAATTFVGTAFAETAEALFAKGEKAMERRDYDAACAAFATSYQMSDGKGALYKLAKCDDARGGRLATQLKNWKNVRDRFPEKPEIVSEAEKRISALTEQVAKVTIRRGAGVPAGLRAELDGRQAPFDEPIPVDAGKHSVVGTSPGDKPLLVDTFLKDGDKRTVELGPGKIRVDDGEVTPLPVPGPKTEETPSPRYPAEPPPSTFPWTTAGLVAGGVGIAGLAVFAISTPILAGASGDIDDACPDRVCTSQARADKASSAADSAEAWQVPNVVGLVVGIVGVGAGVTFLVIGAQSDAPMEVSVGPGHVGARGSF